MPTSIIWRGDPYSVGLFHSHAKRGGVSHTIEYANRTGVLARIPAQKRLHGIGADDGQRQFAFQWEDSIVLKQNQRPLCSFTGEGNVRGGVGFTPRTPLLKIWILKKACLKLEA